MLLTAITVCFISLLPLVPSPRDSPRRGGGGGAGGGRRDTGREPPRLLLACAGTRRGSGWMETRLPGARLSPPGDRVEGEGGPLARRLQPVTSSRALEALRVGGEGGLARLWRSQQMGQVP